ncbi:nuclear transport factor 2 family protein [Altericroceibacterium spongiae]|uniref:Nuclear transport factor 2 family protein n=1 Tax=Altericroceibacterium spongiae TaxID=2320269 RepID=A0A420EM75_9SPHN|nr:nuclear transport factor 2 family protein [Altericroceibacterium spongiae]RKF21783.1 nuclear transport factor 2 family protein [Altericroceibacterium spongiae]
MTDRPAPAANHQGRIAALLDREEIRALRLRYSTLLDTNAADRMDEVFTGDAEVVVTTGSMKGLDEIRNGLASAYSQFDTRGADHFPFVHAVANHEITLTGPNSAEGSCYLLDFVTDRPGDRHPFLLLGRYLDRYVRVTDGWRIARTALDVVWPHHDL